MIRQRAQNAVRKAVTRFLDYEVKSHRIDGDTIVGRRVEGLENVSLEGLNHIGNGVRFAGPISLGLCTTVHTECLLFGPLTIGRYCQIAPRTMAFPEDHPLHQITTFTHDTLLGGVMRQYVECDPIEIESGVWVGAGVTLVRGAAIGNGAVVGAGSVVTQSIPAYSVAVGSPARVVAMRYPTEIIDIVESSRWWTLGPDELERHRAFFEIDLEHATPEDIDRLRLLADSLAESAA